MNPVDYWYSSNQQIQACLGQQFEERITSNVLGDDLRKDMLRLYRQGGFTEKEQVLTVLAAIHLYFD